MPSSNTTDSENLSDNLSQNTATARPDAVIIDCEDRWQVYHRLQMLGIDASCKSFQPLQVTVNSPTEAIQLWSVIRQLSAPRHQLIAALYQSWQLKPHSTSP
ncbi:MAG: Asr1405/Asl0597 family protein [Phormidesmis sp.]